MINNKIIALTFDDGPNEATTIPVLDVLEKHSIVASFFVCGEHISDTTKPILKRAFNMGCEINNHSYSHPNMTELSEDEIIEEVEKTSNLIVSVIGEPPKFFRPPYIAINQKMFDVINLPFINGYGSNDWDNNVSVEDRSSKIVEQISDGGIILLHDLEGNYKTVKALDLLIPTLLNQGYSFVTVSNLFKFKDVTPKLHSNILYSNVVNPTVCKF